MPELSTVVIFALAVVVFAVVPGPAVFYIVTRSVTQGHRAGVLSAAAVGTGNFVHVVAATVGLSALLASSALAFSVVKYLGAAYLVYLGVRTILRSGGKGQEATPLPRAMGDVFRQGVVVAVLNPKTALFFLAFLPQFVDPARGSTALQLLVLGALLVVITATTDSCYAVLTGAAGGWLRSRAPAMRNLRYASGGAYIALGVTAAATGERPATSTALP